jgi:hypothetical protein
VSRLLALSLARRLPEWFLGYVCGFKEDPKKKKEKEKSEHSDRCSKYGFIHQEERSTEDNLKLRFSSIG